MCLIHTLISLPEVWSLCTYLWVLSFNLHGFLYISLSSDQSQVRLGFSCTGSLGGRVQSQVLDRFFILVHLICVSALIDFQPAFWLQSRVWSQLFPIDHIHLRYESSKLNKLYSCSHFVVSVFCLEYGVPKSPLIPNTPQQFYYYK